MQLKEIARSRRGLMGVTIAALAVSASFLLLTAQDGVAPPAPLAVLEGVDLEDLGRSDYFLAPPVAESNPQITAEAAADYAKSQFGGGLAIRQVVLAQLTILDPARPLDRLVWVLNIDPASGIAVPSGPLGASDYQRPLFALMFVDAHTGAEVVTLVQSISR